MVMNTIPVVDKSIHYYKFKRKLMNFLLKCMSSPFLLCSHRVSTSRLSQPQNILLTSLSPPGDIKIVDFGLARRLGAAGELREILGTPEYVGKAISRNRHRHTWSEICSSGISVVWVEELTFYIQYIAAVKKRYAAKLEKYLIQSSGKVAAFIYIFFLLMRQLFGVYLDVC